MSELLKELFTKELLIGDSPFEITRNDGITQYSVNLKSGTAQITGSRKLNGNSSSAIDLIVGQPFNGSVAEGATVTITIDAASAVDLAAQ